MLEVAADLATFRQGSSNVTGGVWLKAGDQAFPEAGWSDFPVIILGWWLEGLARLHAGAKTAELLFMDGAFTIQVTRQGEGRVLVQLLDGQASGKSRRTVPERGRLEMSLAALSEAVLRAADAVDLWARANGRTGRDEDALHLGADRLRGVLPPSL